QTDTDGDDIGDTCEVQPSGPTCADSNAAFETLQPNLYILLDKSGSMGGQKWNDATAAIDTIATDLHDEARIGLGIFPTRTGSCGAENRLSVGNNSEAAIQGAIRQNGTLINPGGSTPTDDAMSLVAYGSTNPGGNPNVNNNLLTDSSDPLDSNRSKAVVFIADGGTSGCSSSHSDAVSYAADLASVGIKTYVVGFGSGVNANQLRQLAAAGQTDADPSTGQADYYVASNASTLVNVLRNIATNIISCDYTITPDPANPIDPNKLWVSYTISGSTTDVPPSGFVYDSTTNALSIQDPYCSAIESGDPSTTTIDIVAGCADSCPPNNGEVCDNIDNDCDGTVDEGCS
ncbi:MAG: VWA domain-containing protein, partial [Actinomycetia bacterium]|nr:VWA domain-containing protein [Actinomycetes bacterium]